VSAEESDRGRPIMARYDDPVDLVWLALMRRLGIDVERTDAAYATYDGAGTLAVAVQEDMDPDDCLAQMLLHEVCHALVQGRRALTTLDWGLAYQEGEGLDEEYATHRLQAHFADRVGMREFFAVTTQWRPHWNQMGPEPLRGTEVSSRLARRALENARAWGWEDAIHKALERTAAIAEALGEAAPEGSLWRGATGRHPTTGLPYATREDDGTRCGGCAWAEVQTDDTLVCLQSGLRACTVDDQARACGRYEARFEDDECGRCGACCREGFHEVEVGADEPLASEPDVVVARESGLVIPRPGGRCRLLVGTGVGGSLYRCTRYSERPTSCRDFAMGSDNCLLARRRVGLSRG